jgi:hypothetical protein
MSPAQFSAFLAAFMPAVVRELMQSRDIPFMDAVEMLYTSGIYEDLIDESTKVWKFAPKLIVELLDEELRTGDYDYPETQ